MNILIYGSKGWIGQQFVSILDNNNITYKIGVSRVDDKLSLLSEINKINPTHII